MTTTTIQSLIDFNGKKFDVCLMNPPYNRSLHLKFLEKVIGVAEKTVSVQPVRWLQDPFFQGKRSTLKQYEKLAKQLNDVDVIDLKDKGKFDMHSYSGLAIYYIDNQDNNKLDYNNFWKNFKDDAAVSIIEKVCYSNKCKYLADVVESNERDGIRVMVAKIAGNRGILPVYKDISYTIDGMVDGKDWTKCKNMGGYQKEEGTGLPNSIKFDTVKEAENFYDSYKNLKFFEVICDLTVQQQHIQIDRLPFLKDYTHKITNEQMYKLFDLTDDEIDYIENYVSNYKKERQYKNEYK